MPPKRASRAWTSTRKPSGPHHDSKPCFVVHNSQSSPTFARYVRSMTTFGLVVWPAAADLLLSFMYLAPCLGVFHLTVASRAPLPSGQVVLPTNCGTARATYRVRGKAPA